jgi:heterodisulfide reductase subunit D
MVKDWDIEVEFAMVTFDKAIKSGKLKVAKSTKEKVTYHDPCHLSRVCNIYDEPRNVIKSTGAEIKEMKLSRNYSFCCGAGSGVRNNYPEIAHAIGKERIKMAKDTGADVLVTPCPMCYMHLKDNSDGKIKVKEATQMLLEDVNEKGGRK